MIVLCGLLPRLIALHDHESWLLYFHFSFLTYLLKPGDIYFVPKAYPHHIENLGPGQLHFLIFFDQAMPGDVGFSGSIRSFSNEVLGAVLKTDPRFFDQLQKYYEDLFIVDRINPIDQ